MEPDSQIKKKILSYKVRDLKTLILAVQGTTRGFVYKKGMQDRCLSFLNRSATRPTLLEAMETLERRTPVRRGLRLGARLDSSSQNGREAPKPEVETGADMSPAVASTSSSSGSIYVEVQPGPVSPASTEVVQEDTAAGSSGQAHVWVPEWMQHDLFGRGRLPPGVKLTDLPFFGRSSEYKLIPLRRLTGIAPRKNDERNGVTGKMGIFLIPQPVVLTAQRSGVTDVILRFGDLTLASSEGEMEDMFPPNLKVVVDGAEAYVGVEKKPGSPINITNFLSNEFIHEVTINWEEDGTQHYVMSVLAGTPLTDADLLSKLLDKPPLPDSVTMGIIRRLIAQGGQQLDGEACASMSVTCPISKTRLQFPCRSTECTHLRCFDGANLLGVGFKAQKLPRCPFCDIPLKFDNLRKDEFIANILSELPEEAGQEIIFFSDGWSPAVVLEREVIEVDSDTESASETEVDSSDHEVEADEDVDEDVIILNPVQENAASVDENGNREEPEVVDVDDWDDDE